MPVCARCGQDNPDIAKFCLACGAPLAPAETVREVRKVVTVVFADVTGSTALGERVDPESMRRVMSRYFDEFSAVIERHGGTVEKFIGDAVMAVFGVPFVHEDDALRAVRAAAEMQARAGAVGEELEREVGVSVQFRIGVNTGEIVTGDSANGQRLATGDAVNVAARLEQAAEPGQILLGHDTHELVRDAVEAEPLPPLQAKGKEQPLRAYRLLAVRAADLGRSRRLDSPLVGREREQRLLGDAFERAHSERACHLFTLLGPAGVGKSRLVLEFLAGAEKAATLIRGRCLPYGDGITYWPLAEALGEAAALRADDSPDAARSKLAALVADVPDADVVVAGVAGALGIGEATASREETFWSVRKLLEALARAKPLVAVFDDIHWAEPTFLDLIEHIADWSRDAPILLLGIARPELLDERPQWAGGKLNATSVLLEPLSESESERLIENLIGRAHLDEHVRARIGEAAEGNPLFVEEMLAMLIDDGFLRRANGDWEVAGDLGSLRIPPTIHALLAARLDRLNGDERAAIERAAVEGKVFHLGAVAELAGEDLRPRVGTSLLALVRKELVRPDQPQFSGEDAFRFRHLLIRDAAYESISKELRADLHERFAEWLERKAGDGAAEFAEILGYHLEQAVRYREQLGRYDDRTAAIAGRAAGTLGAAARRRRNADPPAASTLFERAAALLAAEDPMRIELLIDRAECEQQLHRFDLAAELLGEAHEQATAIGDRRLVLLGELERTKLGLSTEGVTGEETLRVGRAAVEHFEEAGDELGLAKAWSVVGEGHHMQNRFEKSAAAFEEARAYARRAAPMLEAQYVRSIGISLGVGPTPVEDAIPRCHQLREQGGASRLTGTVYDSMLGILEALRGRIDEARPYLSRSVAMSQEIGNKRGIVGGSEWACVAELVAGDPVLAEREMLRGYRLLEEAGERGYLSTMAAHLAEAVYRQERLEEAERYTIISEEAGAADDVVTQMMWRQVRAKIRARRGEQELAEKLAREAVALGETTDALVWHGDALVDLGLVLRDSGRNDDAAAAFRRARELYEEKGATALVARADRLIAGAAG